MTDLEKKIYQLEGRLIAHRVFIPFALTSPDRIHARKQLQSGGVLVRATEGDPKIPEIADQIYQGFRSEQDLLRRQLKNLDTVTSISYLEGRLAAQRAFMILASQDFPGTDTVGEFGVVLEAMKELTEPVLEYLETLGIDRGEFGKGYQAERDCLTRALTRYRDKYVKPKYS